jgi:hypothetical protein
MATRFTVLRLWPRFKNTRAIPGRRRLLGSGRQVRLKGGLRAGAAEGVHVAGPGAVEEADDFN